MKNFKLVSALIVVSAVGSGCATYRTDSNITAAPSATTRTLTPVLIAEDSLPKRKYKEIGPVEVSVKKLTVFNADPTKEMANDALIEKARLIGADAVIKVTYKTGIGMTTWGYIDASGTGVKLAD